MSAQFSVVTPCLNAASSLRRCVGSVRGQHDVRVEHIVQDACSTDQTVEWLRGQSDLDWRSESDHGMYDAINRGWRRSTGQVLSWLNADEQYLPGTLEAVADVFRRRPETDIVFGNMIMVDAAGNPLAARREIPLRNIYLRNRFLYAFSCTLFFHRRLFDDGELAFETKYRYAADYELMLRLLRRPRQIVHLSKYLSLFGVDGRNLSGSVRAGEEGEEIRMRYGAFARPAMRAAVAALRVAERLVAGCYLHRPVSYQFALDEVPNYRRVERVRTAPRFDYARTTV